jgi:hypothetical protein
VVRSKLFFCSDSTSIDARSNALSAFNIIEQLNAPSFPVVVPRLAILIFLSREEGDPSVVQLQLQIFSGTQQLFGGPLAVNFVQQLSTRTIVELNGLLVPAPAELRLVLRDGDQLLDTWTVTVNQVGQPTAQLILPPPPQPVGPAR